MYPSYRAFAGALVVAVLCGCRASGPSATQSRVSTLSGQPFVDDPAQAVVTDVEEMGFGSARKVGEHRKDEQGDGIGPVSTPLSARRRGQKSRGLHAVALAKRQGVINAGVLMVHFADDPDWRVWIGDDLTPKFVGRPGDAREFTETGAMHKAKEAYLNAAMAKAKLASDNASRSNPDKGAATRKAWSQTDALVDGLLREVEFRTVR